MELPDLPPRPRLRPGLHVVRRDAATLQIGVDPPARVLAPDTDGVRRLLAALRAAQPLEPLSTDAFACLIDLLAVDLVVDSTGPSTLTAQFGSTAAERARSRAAVSIEVSGVDPLARQAADALIAAGVSAPRRTQPPTARLMLSEGEPVRGPIDDLVREGAPHLLVTSRAGCVELGPFVSPGLTACLRCVDAHRAESDPRRRLVVEQISQAVAGGAPEPRDSLVWSLALAWAVRDLVRFAEGDRPSTWSTSYEIGPLHPPRGVEWMRHPHCGCAWDALVTY